jgi:recombination protein RecR
VDSINKLTEYFIKFPGVGPRQARRMVYYLLRQRKDVSDEIAKMIVELKHNVAVCQSCFRHFVPSPKGSHTTCVLCSNPQRDTSVLMIVEKDVDFENIERSGVYRGVYFILGGLYAPLSKEPEAAMRSAQLMSTITQRAQHGLQEIIIALAVNPDGEETAHFIADKIRNLNIVITVTMLGRGLSTGSELEYADPDTIKNAFESRK